jgi:hypothetical protein
MIAIGWVGVFFLIIGLIGISPNVVNSLRYPVVYDPGWIIGINTPPSLLPIVIFGAILALIGGFTAKPRLFWLALVVCGAICSILSLFEFIPEVAFSGLKPSS